MMGKERCILCGNVLETAPDSPHLDAVEDMKHVMPQHKSTCPARIVWEERTK